LNRLLARLKTATAVVIPGFLLAAIAPAQAQTRAPDVVNTLKIKPNPTATVTAVCHKLGEKAYPQSIHASCYSEVNQAVVVLLSGNTKEYSGETIAKFVIGEFEKAHVPAAGFLRSPELNGVGMTFLLNGDAYGPYSGENWRKGFDEVKRHAPQAWFKR